MKYLILLLLPILLINCQSAQNQEVIPFSSFLGYGAHEVGFKTLYEIDFSRESVPYSDWDGRIYPSRESFTGRNLPIHIWYPATKTDKALTFQHFVHLLTKQSSQEAKDFTEPLSKQMYLIQTNALSGDTVFTELELNKLLSLQTGAYLNANATEGKFPLVIFPNGSSPANQSVMGEFLASHGYVVAAMALKGEFTHGLDVSTKGLEIGVDDLQFALQKLLALPNVDGNQIALMGNAIESSFCAGLAARNKKIKALVSLEGGFLSKFEQDILDKTNFYTPQSITLPILAIYAPHPSISPTYIKQLKYSKRYFAHFPQMTEFHFLNYGLFEEYVPNIIGEKKGDTKEGYYSCTKLILAFLDAQLKNQQVSLKQYYAKENTLKLQATIDSLFIWEGLPASPNIAIMKQLFLNHGMAAVDSVYQTHLAGGDKTPFSINFYKDFRSWLAWGKDPSYTHRKHLFQLAIESYPKSALINYYLAYYLEMTKDFKASKSYYLAAQKLLDTDTDISSSLNARMSADIKEVLKTLEE